MRALSGDHRSQRGDRRGGVRISRNSSERNRQNGCGYCAQAPHRSLPGGPPKAYFLNCMASISKRRRRRFSALRFVASSAVGTPTPSLLESSQTMADWKQITARIRRARTSKDPAGQLTNLFSKTRDGMVAFELARYFESSGNSSDAGKWYLTAAQRFRRSDWKTKAEESAARIRG